MNKKQRNTEPLIMSVRDFFRQPARVHRFIKAQRQITVTYRGVPFFDIVPRQDTRAARLHDFLHLQFSDSSLSPELSKEVDHIIYE